MSQTCPTCRVLQEWLLGPMTLQNLVSRIGSEHVERRLKVEAEHEAQLFGQGRLFFNLENWRLAPWLIMWGLKFAGLYERARRNADEIVVRRRVTIAARLTGRSRTP